MGYVAAGIAASDRPARLTRPGWTRLGSKRRATAGLPERVGAPRWRTSTGCVVVALRRISEGPTRWEARYPGVVRSRSERGGRLLGVGLAFALVFAPGEALATSAGSVQEPVSTKAVAIAVLAPTFVSTPLLRPDPSVLVEHGDRFTQPAERLPRSVVMAVVTFAAALVGLLRRGAGAPSTDPFPAPASAPRYAWRLRAPPLSVGSQFA